METDTKTHPEGRESQDRQGLRDRKWTQGQGKTESQGPQSPRQIHPRLEEEDHRQRVMRKGEREQQREREREEERRWKPEHDGDPEAELCWCLTTWD